MIQIQMRESINIDIDLNILLKQGLLFVINPSVKYKRCKARFNRLQFPAI